MKETALGLLIPEDADVPDGPSQVGGNAEKADALLQRSGALAKKTVNVPGESTRESGTFGGLLDAADEVKGIVVAANELIAVTFRAFAKPNDERPMEAALFVGENQLKVPSGTGAPVAQSTGAVEATAFRLIGTTHYGLDQLVGASSDVTTGEALSLGSGVGGGACLIFGLAAGTYNISVRYRAEGGGKAVVKNRVLTARRLGFA